jgi:hypothetical protein
MSAIFHRILQIQAAKFSSYFGSSCLQNVCNFSSHFANTTSKVCASSKVCANTSSKVYATFHRISEVAVCKASAIFYRILQIQAAKCVQIQAAKCVQSICNFSSHFANTSSKVCATFHRINLQVAKCRISKVFIAFCKYKQQSVCNFSSH